MDWGDLPFFLAVAEHGTLARAAARMRTDPTTVGRRIQRLERALGARLFEHSQAGHVVTAAGEHLLEKARAMASLANEAETAGAVGAGETQVTGTVRISVAEGFGSWFVSRRIGAFAATYPGLTVDLVASSGFLNPTRRETDLAVLLARPRRGPLVTRKLTDYSLGLYASRRYLDESGPIEATASLRHHRLIGYVPDIIYAPELRYLDEIPDAESVTLRSSSINAQHGMIASGAGIGILPHFIGTMDGMLVPLLPEVHIQRSFWLATHRETAAFPQVRAMIDWLVDMVGEARNLFVPDAYPTKAYPTKAAQV